ncbi:MAG TPA: hypothetical protein PKE30_13935 [Niabella sp.]|nr:hypothetical protein [Niabella sp.]
MIRYFFILLFVVVSLQLFSQAQVWQWSVPVRGATREGATAYLWIPEDAAQIKGVILAQNNMEEICILESSVFRGTMKKLSFAIVWVSPFFDHLFRFDQGADEVLDGFMADLAKVSGYDELNFVPFVTIGHSAAASWPYYYAARHPERTLCALSVSGQWPYFRDPKFAPDIWGSRNIDSIPCLQTMGEYEAAANMAKIGVKQRSEHPLIPLSMLACPGEGHFSTTEKKNKYFCLYIEKAAQYRYPKNYDGRSPARLRAVDPLNSGWLMERWDSGKPASAPPAPVHQYKGDRSQAFWFFDEEMVRATQTYQSTTQTLPQLVGIEQDGQLLPQRNTHLQLHPQFLPKEDGITFHLKGVFYDTVPGGSPRPQSWTGLPVGTKIGHSSQGSPFIEWGGGPWKKLDDTTFRFYMRNGENGRKDKYSLIFIASHPGDDRYKAAFQQAEMLVPVKNNGGVSQNIHFPAIPVLKNKTKRIRLNAVSDQGLLVQYYVESGPAFIEGNVLMLTKIPPKAKLPIKVSVAAWQYGIPGKVQSAQPVKQHFFIPFTR